MSMRSRSNWNLEVLVFKERGKPEYLEKNLSEQGREPATNSTHIWRLRWDLNRGHIGGRRVLSPLRHPCSLLWWFALYLWVLSLHYLQWLLLSLIYTYFLNLFFIYFLMVLFVVFFSSFFL